MTAERSPRDAATSLRGAILALASAGFVIGTTEFTTMGLLPQMAESFSVQPAGMGVVVAAYAVGVVVGAPTLALLMKRWPVQRVLIALMLIYAIFNAATALAHSLGILWSARFVVGLPHGAYGGLSALVAASLVPAHLRARTVAQVMLGMSVGVVAGVPAATWIGQTFGWRVAFGVIACAAAGSAALIWLLVPNRGTSEEGGTLSELASFIRNPRAWLAVMVGVIGFGGMFATYSFAAINLVHVGGLTERAVPLFLFVFGVGMVAGTWLGGEISSMSITAAMVVATTGTAIDLVFYWLVLPHGYFALPATFLVTTFGSILVVALQLRLIEVAVGAEAIGAAMNHSALNLANALGAWLGGIALASAPGGRANVIVGLALASAGVVMVLLGLVLDRSVSSRAQVRSA